MHNNKEKNSCYKWWCCDNSKKGVSGIGIVFLIVGGFFLAQELGWVATDVSLWPVFFVALGIYFIARKQ